MAGEESMASTEGDTLELPPDAGFVTSCPKLEPKHKIFLSHSGFQKPFVEQLCKDLEALNQFPFFDQRSDSLPLGMKFSTLIIDAAKQCLVAVVVLSREYLSSKWPMLELVEFVRARRSSNKSLSLFPRFYKASVDDLSDRSIQNQWMPRWKELVGGDHRVNLEEWTAAVRELHGVNGPRFEKFGNSEVKYRDAIVESIFRLAPPQFLFDTSKIVGRDRICEILAGMFLPHTRTSAQVLGLYGMGGLGKTSISKSLCNHFNQQFSWRVCYIEIKEGVGALERQKMVMRKLLESPEMLLQRICDVSEVNREKEVLGVWCVGKGGVRLPLELVRTPPGRCWPELKRIRLGDLLCEGFLKGKVQEWCNVVVLQIVDCGNITTINLQGLVCLRHLELQYLMSLKILSFTGDGSTSSTSGVSQESFVEPRQLQFVIIDTLPALRCLPSFSSFTALKHLKVVSCEGLTQFPSIHHCIGLERFHLWWNPNQGTLLSLWGLTSLRDLTIYGSFDGYWGETLKLEGLSSLISLGALELWNVPVGDLSGLENLKRLEFLKMLGTNRLTCLPPLDNLARSSLHVLELSDWFIRLKGG